MSEKSAKKENSSKLGRNLVIIIFLIGFSTLVYYIFNGYNINTNIRLVTLPLLQTPVYSSSTGEEHIVQTNISYAMDKKYYRNYKEQDAIDITTSTIESLDYDRLNQPDGTEYLKSELQKNISQVYPEVVDMSFSVYISGYDLGLVNGFLPGLIEEDSIVSGKLEKMFSN